MKIRNGFVSNSSSSSFVCDVCGHTETGYDGYYEIEVVECVNGHCFCSEHIINSDDTLDIDNYEVESIHCPICRFHTFSESDVSKYLLKKFKIPRELVFQKIKEVNKRRKKLYNYEYIEYVLRDQGLTTDVITGILKDEFENYENFMRWLNEN